MEIFLVSSGFESIDMIEAVDQINAYDPNASDFMSTQLRHLLPVQSIITHVDGSDEFQSISAINSKFQYRITPEELSSRWCIGLNTASCTLKSTTHQYIHTTYLFTKRFRTDKAHLHYKQLYWQYGTFYTDFLKLQVTSSRGYCWGVLYNNNIGFKNFFPCESDKGEETDR